MGRKDNIAVTPEKEQEFALRVRIPGWAQDAPVPTDLYSFTDKAQAYSISVNGSKVNAKQYDGYATLVRNWKAGDVVEINLPMEVRRVKANDQVEDDRGKLAIERGPIMFCLEGTRPGRQNRIQQIHPRRYSDGGFLRCRFVEWRIGAERYS